MGKHQLKIVFDGVIAVGPAPPTDGSNLSGERLFAVMASSPRQRTTWSLINSGGQKPEPVSYIPVHVPTLLTKMEPVTGGRPFDEEFKGWKLWHPSRERMEFVFDDRGEAGTLTFDRSGPDSDGTIRSVADVPDMREIEPDRCYLKETLLDRGEKNKPVATVVAAQVFVPRGKVGGGGDDEKRRGVEAEFLSGPPRTGTTKKIVPHPVITVDEVEEIRVRTFSLDTGDELDPLLFRLTRDEEIRISNGDPSDMKYAVERHTLLFLVKLFLAFLRFLVTLSFVRSRFVMYNSHPGIKILRPCQKGGLDGVDHDFELVYTLLEGTTGPKGLRIPVRKDGDCANCFCCFVCAPKTLTRT